MRELKDFKLIVNDKEILCKDFVQEIIANGLLGMVETLDMNDKEGKKISDIQINIKFF